MELMDPSFYHAFEMDDVPWPTVEAVGAAFAHADTDYTPVMPAEELEMPPNEYFSGFDQRCQTVRRRVTRALSPAEGETLRVLIVAHSPHIPIWFFDDLIQTAPHHGYCSMASQAAGDRGGLTVTLSTDHLERNEEIARPPTSRL